MAPEHVDEEREEAIRADERKRMREQERYDADHDDHEHDDAHDQGYRRAYVRGGVSFGSIVTGTAVAFGAFSLLTMLAAGIAVAIGVTADAVDATPTEIGWGVGIVLVLIQFLAYFWGGYTAGRMARGAGILNGLLVPVLALLVLALAVGLVAAFGGEARFAVPFTDFRVPVEEDVVFTWGIGLGIATLVVMFLGGILGGMLGARWHDKLEAVAGERDETRRVA